MYLYCICIFDEIRCEQFIMESLCYWMNEGMNEMMNEGRRLRKSLLTWRTQLPVQATVPFAPSNDFSAKFEASHVNGHSYKREKEVSAVVRQHRNLGLPPDRCPNTQEFSMVR
jgi:hypothetical protein